MRLLLSPGMDGGDQLLRPFCRWLPDWIESEIVAYPADEPLGYHELEALVRARLALSREPTAILAESFSGPIAIRIGADPPENLRALVLVATFAVVLRLAWLRHLLAPAILCSRRIRPPRALVRRSLLDVSSDAALVDAVRASIGATAPATMIRRIREALSIDVRDELARVEAPILYITARHDRMVGTQPLIAARAAQHAILDAPHLVLQCAPERSAAVVTTFLSEHRA